MSALMAERRELADEGRQESLFEAHAPPRAPERNPWAPPLAPPRDAVIEVPSDDAVAPPPDEALALPPDEALAPPREAAPATEAVGERRVPLAAGKPLAGPTLDDVMSRVWEGLATGLPAACPLCHGEVEPALGGPLSGRCRSCGTAVD
jgi:hypothetical protein